MFVCTIASNHCDKCGSSANQFANLLISLHVKHGPRQMAAWRHKVFQELELRCLIGASSAKLRSTMWHRWTPAFKWPRGTLSNCGRIFQHWTAIAWSASRCWGRRRRQLSTRMPSMPHWRKNCQMCVSNRPKLTPTVVTFNIKFVVHENNSFEERSFLCIYIYNSN